MKISKLLAGIYVLLVACLTITYFLINEKVMIREYKLILGLCSISNIILLLIVVFSPSKNFYWLVVFFMLITGIAKSMFERTIPGKNFDDFIFSVWKFNDNWNFLMKMSWHTTIDWFVLFITVFLKNSYKLFQKAYKGPGRVT